MQTGMLSGMALTNLDVASAQPISLLRVAHDLSMSGSISNTAARTHGNDDLQRGVRASNAEALPSSNSEAGLEAENQRLKEQLQEAQEAAVQWQTLHSELHYFCMNKVIAAAQT